MNPGSPTNPGSPANLGSPTPPTAPAVTRPRINPAVALATLALVLVAAVWLHQRDQTRDLKTDMARKLAETDSVVKESKLLSRNADEVARQFSERLTQAESQLADTATQRQALEALYQAFSRDRDQAILADIEQTLLAAAQQLQLNGNLKSAIITLEAADQRISRLDKPQFVRLRQAISNDLGKLRAMPVVDHVGMSLALNSLSNASAQWPLSSAHTRRSKKNDSPVSLGKGLLDELKNIVQIRRIEHNEPALLTPTQDYFLRQNLKLRLLSARFSLLARDAAGYQADLRDARTILARYFNTQDAGVASASATLDKLLASNIAPAAPQLESLADVQRLINL